MELGLIGNPLSHSWSPEIHKFFVDADYKLWPLEPNELDDFFVRRDFDGINVTIPYKRTVIRYLDKLSEAAANIGAVNCIINKDGKLTGHNTDVTGLLRMIEHHGIKAGNGDVAILGSGGASKAAAEACRIMNWRYHIVSRSPEAGMISYDQLERIQEQITILINATPVGMYPDIGRMPVNPEMFTRLGCVIDIIANPIRTALCYEAERLGIKAYGGLEMLVAQALAADELFCERSLDGGLIDGCMNQLLSERTNIVLIGMPTSGKTTVGRILADKTGRNFIDLDEEFVRRTGTEISDFFRAYGEDEFRRYESEICRDAANLRGSVIAAGGGVIKRPENMLHLASSGRIVWLDRDFGKLEVTDSRPLSANLEDLARLYEERKTLYHKYSDHRIENNGSPEEAADAVIRMISGTKEKDMDIKEAREKINEIDHEMAELFVRRMECAAEIAKYKGERGLPIEDLEREQYLLEKMSEFIEDEVMRSFYISYQKGVMNVSKRWQHRLLEGQKIAFSAKTADAGTDAARRIAPEASIVNYDRYEDAYNAVAGGDCDVCILPMENGCGGEVGRVMDLIYSGNLYINAIYEDEAVLAARDDSRTGRYAVLSRVENQSADKENGAFLLMFTVNDETGSLAKAINMISAYDYNMRIMRSRPMRDLPWHYYFYAEAVGDDTGDNGKRMLNALKVVCPVVKVAGRYSLGDKIRSEADREA